MQVRAVIKFAILCMRFKVRHQLRQLHRLYVVQAKFLKAGRVNQRGAAIRINPIQRGAGRRVLA